MPPMLSSFSECPLLLNHYTRTPLKIGFTYDSRSERLASGLSPEQCVEFEDDNFIDYLAAALRKLGNSVDVDMIGGVKALTQRLASGMGNWDVVFIYSAGNGTVVGREAQATSLLEAWGITTTFSDSATLALCMDKAKTKMVLQHHNIPTAPFTCIPPRESWPNSGAYDPLSAIEERSRHREALASFPLFVKPAASSSGAGIDQGNKATDKDELASIIDRISRKCPKQTLLVETFLTGREFTVGIIGTGADAVVIGVCELIYLDGMDVYGQNAKFVGSENPQRIFLDMSEPDARSVAQVALDAWTALGCCDGGRVDIRHDSMGPNARPHVIEVNPIPGLKGPDVSDLPRIAHASGISYEHLLALIIESALKRRIPVVESL